MSEGGPRPEVKKSNETSQEHEPAVEHEPARQEKEKEPEQLESVDELRHEVEKHSEDYESETSAKTTEKAPQTNVSVSDKKKSYTQTMRRVRSQMNPARRAFSAFIHAPGVEQASEFAGKTVGRPSGVIGGALAACIGLGMVLFYARRSGFALSGSEFIILLVGGWVVGIITEKIIRIIRRR